MIIIIILIILFIINNSRLKLFMAETIFSLVAPSSKQNLKLKNISDEIYKSKVILEDDIKKTIDNEYNLLQIKTVLFENIKDSLTEEMFYNITNEYTTPLLIKNVFSYDELKNYNYNYIIKNHGNTMVQAVNNTTNIDTIELTFEEYIKSLRKGDKLYLTVNNSIANILDVEILQSYYSRIFNTSGFKNIFIGNKDSYTHLHCELSASCGIQLNGIKKWYLIDPKYSEHLHSIPDKNNIFRTSAYGFKKNKDKTNMIPHYEIIVEKGDFLFVPPWWWHETLNITDENIMFSYRPSLFIAPYKTNTNYTLHGIKNSLAFNKMVYPLLTKLNIVDDKDDTVVKSIAEIKNRIPDSVRIY